MNSFHENISGQLMDGLEIVLSNTTLLFSHVIEHSIASRTSLSKYAAKSMLFSPAAEAGEWAANVNRITAMN